MTNAIAGTIEEIGTMDEHNERNATGYRVWWQNIAPMGTVSLIDVHSVEEGQLVIDAIASVVNQSIDDGIMQDVCNASGIEVWDEETNAWMDSDVLDD